MEISNRVRLDLRLGVLVAVSVGLLLACFAVSATALAGGNSANAKKCQKNGWQSLITSTGAAFTSEEQCVSYAAKGGVLLPQSQGPCLNGGWQAPAQRDDGTPFASQDACTTYTAGGGVVFKPSLTAVPSDVVEDEGITLTASGFHANSAGQLSIQVLPIAGIPSVLAAVTDGTGGLTASNVFTAGACGLGDTGAQYTYTDANGVHASASSTLHCT
jgi:hypothetical protein